MIKNIKSIYLKKKIFPSINERLKLKIIKHDKTL